MRRISVIEISYFLLFFISCFRRSSVMIFIWITWEPLSPLRNSTIWLSMEIIRLLFFFLFIYLIRNNIKKPALLCIQCNGIVNSSLNHRRFKGTADIIGCAQIVCFRYKLGRAFRRYHDNGNIFNDTLPVHALKHLVAVHSGHNYIEQDQRYLTDILLQYINGALAAVSFVISYSPLSISARIVLLVSESSTISTLYFLPDKSSISSLLSCCHAVKCDEQ